MQNEHEPLEPSSAPAPLTCVICDSPRLKEIRKAEIDRLDQVSFSYTFSPEHNRTFRVVSCEQCSHAFCAPLPQGIVDRYHDVVDDEYLTHSESRRIAAEVLLRLAGEHVPTGRLLDVGCATGDLLLAARQLGYSAEGLELSTWSSKLARAQGFTVHQESLASLAKRSPASYDLITLIGVIEHFPDPRAEMANLTILLRPGGILLIWTGDRSSILARALGRRWWYWQGQHIQYFTERSLRRLATDARLQHISSSLYTVAVTHATISNSLKRYRFNRLMSAALTPIFTFKPVIHLKLPGEMLFVARRPKSPVSETPPR